jgi:integration host factor subunit beta
MIKSQLIELLQARHGQLEPEDSGLIVATILEAIARTLAAGHRVEIRGFGSFALNHRSPRTGRNPKTGQQVAVPTRYLPRFKAGKELRQRVDRPAS